MKKIITLLLAMLLFTSCSGENLQQISKVSNDNTTIVSSDTTSTETECSTTTEITTITTAESQDTEIITAEGSIYEENLLKKWSNEIDKIKSDENVAEQVPPSLYQVDNYLVAVYYVEGDIFGSIYCLMNNDRIIHFYSMRCANTRILIQDGNVYISDYWLKNSYHHYYLDIFNLSTGECTGNCLITYGLGSEDKVADFSSTIPEINSLEDLQKYIKNISDNWVDI